MKPSALIELIKALDPTTPIQNAGVTAGELIDELRAYNEDIELPEFELHYTPTEEPQPRYRTVEYPQIKSPCIGCKNEHKEKSKCFKKCKAIATFGMSHTTATSSLEFQPTYNRQSRKRGTI